MTSEQAQIWNAAIEQAARTYPQGVWAILALRKKFVVTVQHIGRSTKQEVQIEEEDC